MTVSAIHPQVVHSAAAIEVEITRLLRSRWTVSDVILRGQQSRAWRLEDVARLITACGWSINEDDDRVGLFDLPDGA